MIARSRCAASKATDQVEAERLLGVEQRDAGERSVGHPPRLGAHERRRHHHPPVEHDGVDAHVVAVDLPAPRLSAPGSPKIETKYGHSPNAS